MEYIKDEYGRIWRKYDTAIKKNKASVIDAYNNGKCEKVMRLELPIKTCIAVLNELYQSGINVRRFYKDLGPVFGESYVFSISDLLNEGVPNKVCFFFFTEKGDKKEIKCLCLASIVICILSKALEDRRIKQGYYNAVLKKYSKYDFSHLSPEKRAKEKERAKKKLEREQARKEWEMRPKIIYTPMGNDKRRK
ncbi:MAG: hypothetical protein IKH37_11480 [Prevotella sp.]|nr:hypothetical protein [Prevotella sp.]